ncbi:MAG TPA: FtsQ-type POTRA domain-containing protein [Gaiellaceae bacterium]
MRVVPFPQRPRLGRPDLARLAPSGRSLVAAVVLAATAGLAYVGGRETSVFAVRTVSVRGASPRVATEVQRALRPLEGTSLLALGGEDVDRRLAGLPDVASASYDRSFPHTLTVVVVPEQPVAVVRRGAGSWLVSARGRILRPTVHGALPWLPRIWLAAAADTSVGTTLARDSGGDAAAALAVARRVGFRARIVGVTVVAGALSLKLASGLELRLGTAQDVPLKLAVAARILPLVGSETTYLDVSVPSRPVAMTPPAVAVNPQVGGRG